MIGHSLIANGDEDSLETAIASKKQGLMVAKVKAMEPAAMVAALRRHPELAGEVERIKKRREKK